MSVSLVSSPHYFLGDLGTALVRRYFADTVACVCQCNRQTYMEPYMVRQEMRQRADNYVK